MSPNRSLLAAAAALWLAPSAVALDAEVYAVPAGAPTTGPEPPVVLNGGAPTLIDLYIHKGDTPGSSPCLPQGSGDLICAYDVVIGIEGMGFFNSMMPEAGVTVFPGPVNFMGTTHLRAVFTQAAAVAQSPPMSIAPLKIGTLNVDGVTPGQSTTVFSAPPYDPGSNPPPAIADWTNSNRHVGADLSLLGIASRRAIAVPEPNPTLQLLVGVLGLVLLYWTRSRRVREPLA